VNEKTLKFWVDSSDYDLETMEAMFETERLLYVGFMAHQSIEKILKGFYVKLYKEIPPFTHNLILLAEKNQLKNELSEDQIELLSLLNPLNIEARYPKYKDDLLKSLSKDKCLEIISKTKNLQKWVKSKLEIV